MARLAKHTLILAAVFLTTAAPANAGPSAEALSTDWNRDAAARASMGGIQADLTAEDFAALAGGEVVRRLVPSGEGLAAVGVVWTEASPASVWVAIQDVEDRPINRDQALTRRLEGDTLVRRLNYNLVHTPWPISDRQSVSSVTANTALWAATNQQVWERTLKLEDSGLADEVDPEAVWLERLGGGFLVVEAAGGSLVVFRIDTDPGGNVPADLVARFAYLGLNTSLETLAKHAEDAPRHYSSAHPAVALPDGNMLEPGSLPLTEQTLTNTP